MAAGGQRAELKKKETDQIVQLWTRSHHVSVAELHNGNKLLLELEVK